MKYRTGSLFVFLIYQVFFLQAQDYQINFKGSSATNNIINVKVENLTQGTNQILGGTDILHLVKTTTSIEKIKDYGENKVTIYPNPMQEYSLMRFDLPADGNAFIEIITISGNGILKHQNYLTRGEHFYRIQGLQDGMYLIRIQSNNYSATGKLICTGNFKNNPGISYENTIESSENDIISKADEENNNSKGISSDILMQYNAGDRLKFTGTSDKYSTVIVKTPTESQTITFDFLPCSDIDGNNYQVVRIGEQTWMAENLKATKLNDGTIIPDVTDSYNWKTLTTPGYSWYNNDEPLYKNKYGAIYNWFVVNSGKICPDGWHVPNDAEWDILTDYLGGLNVAGGKLKETGILNWSSPNTGATNESGFTAIAGGNRDTEGTYVGSGSFGAWWSSTELNPGIPLYRLLYYRNSSLEKAGSKNTDGFSIRCIRDESKAEEAFPGIEGENIDFIIGTDTIICELINGQYVFQGDIILTEDQLNLAKGGGYSSLSKRWPEGIVYYSIDDAVPNQSRIYEAIAEYESRTNNLIKFIKRTDQISYVEFQRSDNAYSESTYSFLGFITGKQLIKIQDDSKKGVIMHEIGHTIGLIHEHTRKDRDKWVIFYKDNVDEYNKYWKQFKIVNNSLFTEEYDYFSIMGYESGALAKPGLKTTTKKDGFPIFQNREFLTELDIEMIKMLYQGTSENGIIFNPDLTYGSVTDMEGNIYKTIKIGTQTWMAENLRTKKYNNGDLIGTTEPPTLNIVSEETPKYQWAYDGNENNIPIYGRLYTWFAITDNRKICPAGWHIPTDGDWSKMILFLDPNRLGGLHESNIAGGLLKEVGTNHWLNPNLGATNESGITALPGGYRGIEKFERITYYSSFWSSTAFGVDEMMSREILNNYTLVWRSTVSPKNGLSVRCIKDN